MADVQFLYAALDKLPDRQREALILFEITGYSVREIARLQGKSEAATKMLLSRGRKKLADLLKDPIVGSEHSSRLPGYFQTASMLLL